MSMKTKKIQSNADTWTPKTYVYENEEAVYTCSNKTYVYVDNDVAGSPSGSRTAAYNVLYKNFLVKAVPDRLDGWSIACLKALQ